ncbi:MAG: CorA family divalent cation transporter [Pirellulales bacterium]|nr:CorA family divalent cation transporter [Pirellulales bacterium]
MAQTVNSSQPGIPNQLGKTGAPGKSALPPHWALPAKIQARVGESAGRQRAMAEEGQLLLILHAPPGPDEKTREARFFWLDAAGQWHSTLGGGQGALRNHVTQFGDKLDSLETQLQQAAVAGEYFEILQAIVPLQRTSRNLHATLQSARELLPDQRDLITVRDRAGEIERQAELLYHDAKNGLDFLVAAQGEQLALRGYEMSVAAHRLNLLAALFFPLMTVATVFGMNLRHGLEQQGNGELFWLVLGVALLLGMFLTALVAMRPLSAPRLSPSRGTGEEFSDRSYRPKPKNSVSER